jgi:hypothetical protein
MLRLNKIRNILLTALILATGFASFVMAQDESQSVAPYRKVFEYKTPSVDITGDVSHTITFTDDSIVGPPKVNYFSPFRLGEMITLHKSSNDAHTKGAGYRVQIYAGSRMEFANEAKADFIQSYGDFDFSIYQMWQPPHFRVRVGDFLSREEALREMAGFRQVFPDAFIVEDEINMPKFKKQAIVPNEMDGSDDGSELREN